ncbi:Cytochrome P450, E-class, group I [Parasponia andersonii]|uniref:Trans-cinnamate 4-monooxygenase n=1 Tax=Parasponia andersonii TaxID=3476 RepID=A0A2P5DHP2_PARAD|nr:Cytochrome P450, E-class, group I [Parasponia andersonii]
MDLLLFEKTFLALVFATAIAIAVSVSKLRGKRFKLPPVGNNLNHHDLAELLKKYGDVSVLRMGQHRLMVVSSSKLAKEVLVTKGVEFGSRT